MMIQLHVAATFALVGLIWVVQLVIYPLFARIDSFRDYHELYTRRITWVVLPLMSTELVTGIVLAVDPPEGVGPATAWTGLALIAGNWLVTGLVSAPLHGRLGADFERAHRRLVATNWIRTITWSVRGALVTSLL